MSKFHVLFAVIVCVLIWAQYYVVSSLREFMAPGRARSPRAFAFLTIAIIISLNFLFIKLIFSHGYLSEDSLYRKTTMVVFFAYLGCVAALTIHFWLLRTAAATFDVWGYLLRLAYRALGWDRPSKDAPMSAPAYRPVSPGVDLISPSRTTDLAKPTGPGGQEINHYRRAFLKWGAAAGVVSTLSLTGHGIAEAYGEPRIEEFDFCHPSLQGLRGTVTIIHVTDIHFGLFFGSEELIQLIEMVNAIDADALLITGNIFHSSRSPLERAVPMLGSLKPRPLGNFAVLGNHDFYAGVSRSSRCISEAGLTLLRDRWTTLDAAGARILLGGMDDPKSNWLWGSEAPNFGSFIQARPDGEGLRLLMSHRPTVLPYAANEGVHLILAGHTHGGQMIVPAPGIERGVSLARAFYPYTHGWYRQGACSMYLNRGVGLTFMPWRINCPPEIAVIRLKAPGGTVTPCADEQRRFG